MEKKMKITDQPEIFEEIRQTVRERRAETVSLLQRLVRVPSPSGDEVAVQEVVEEAFSGCGLAVERCEATSGQVAPYAEHVGGRAGRKAGPTSLG